MKACVINASANSFLGNQLDWNKMLSDIERVFPTICTNMKIDIDEIVSVRKNRSELFNEQYFTSKFWDIILLLYSHEINDCPINAHEISKNLDINGAAVLRYLNVLFADDIICAYENKADDRFELARDNLSLTRLGFENTRTIIQQTCKIFAPYAKIAG